MMKRFKLWLIIPAGILAISLILISIISGGFGSSISRNQAALQVQKSVLDDQSGLQVAYSDLSTLSQANCRVSWLRGVAAQMLGDLPGRDLAWDAALHCSSDYVSLLKAVDFERQDWAETAVALYPEVADGWFWLAKLTAGEDPVAAENFYRQGLKFNPYDPNAWLELGDLLHEHDPDGAIQAYLQACYNGDPGSNGCFRAGLTAEKLGDTSAAIQYYRLSKWSGAHDRADELEQSQK